MVELSTSNVHEAHISTRAGLTFHKDKIITVGDDSMKKVFSAKDGQEEELMEMTGETYAICSN